MSWLFSRVLVEGFSAGTCSAGGACAPWSARPMPPVFCWPDRMTGFSRLSRFGMMCEPLMDGHGEGLLTWFRAGFRVRTSAAPGKGLESRGSEVDCGRSLSGSLARWDRDSCSWRTHQFSLLGGLELFSETWPRWGMMRGGECWEHTTPGHLTSGIGSGSWPTPRASEKDQGRGADGMSDGLSSWHAQGRGATLTTAVKRIPTPTRADSRNTCNSTATRHKLPPTGIHAGDTLVDFIKKWPTAESAVKLWPTPTKNCSTGAGTQGREGGLNLQTAVKRSFPTPTKQDAHNNGGASQMERNALPLNAVAGGSLNPTWVEWLMGWPLGWTDLQHLGMARFQRWRAAHGKFYTAR